MTTDIKVKVSRNGSRKYFMMYYDDPVTGNRKQRSTRQTTKSRAERSAGVWESELKDAGVVESKTWMRLERITPKKAREWLDAMGPNRNISKRTVSEYLDAIRNEEWCVDGNTIKFGINGVLIDGQHRLLAIEQSGVSVMSWVCRGLSVAAYDVLDQGKVRSTADGFRRENEPNATALASAVRWIHNYRDGVIQSSGRLRQVVANNLRDAHPGIRESVSFCAISSQRRIVAIGVSACLHYLFSIVDKDMADEFWRGVLTGEGLKKTDPALTLRNKLINNKISKSTMSQGHQWVISIKAWNCMRSGLKCKSLRVGAEESIPKIM